MQIVDVARSVQDFEVVARTARSQAATMVLDPGARTGGPTNRHEDSDQWLYVVAGDGEAVIGSERVPLTPGRLLLIEAGETHEVIAGGTAPLVTLNLYAPPEY